MRLYICLGRRVCFSLNNRYVRYILKSPFFHVRAYMLLLLSNICLLILYSMTSPRCLIWFGLFMLCSSSICSYRVHLFFHHCWNQPMVVSGLGYHWHFPINKPLITIMVQNSLLVSLQPEPGTVFSGYVDCPINIVCFNVNRQVGHSYGTSWKESRVNQVFITVQVYLQQSIWKQKLHQNVLVCTSLNIVAWL